MRLRTDLLHRCVAACSRVVLHAQPPQLSGRVAEVSRQRGDHLRLQVVRAPDLQGGGRRGRRTHIQACCSA